MPKPVRSVLHSLAKPEICALILAPILILALVTFPCEAVTFPDNYLEWSKRPLHSKQFWLESKPPTIMFLYKLCNYDLASAVLAQQVLSVLCWLALGLSLAKTKPSPISPLFVPLFGLAACAWNLSSWPFAILTESVSFSLFALFVAFYLPARQKGAPISIVMLCIVTLLFSWTRDQIAYFLLSFFWLALPFEWLWKQPNKRRWLLPAFALGFCLVFLLQAKVASNMGRHAFPLSNVILQRILPDDGMRHWFIDRGAPLQLLIDDHREWRGAWTSSHNWDLHREPKFKPYFDWVRDDAKSLYATFLLSHPSYAITSAYEARDKILSYDLDYVKKTTSPWIMVLADSLWQPMMAQPWKLYLALLLGLVYAVLFIPARLDPLPLVLALCSLGNGIFAFHADAMEIARHCLLTGIGLQLAFWLAVVSLLDGLWRSRLERAQKTATTA